jgi:hypothetical protein
VVDHVARVVHDILDSQVHVGREPAIQLDLAVTHLLAQLRGAQVDKGEADRFLPLAHPITIEHDHRQMRLDHLRPRGRPVEETLRNLQTCAGDDMSAS